MLGILNLDGNQVVGISSDGDGGVLRVNNKDEQFIAGIGASTEGGGIVTVADKEQGHVVRIGSDANGGLVSITNKDGQHVVGTGGDEDGHGAIRTLSNGGELSSTIP